VNERVSDHEPDHELEADLDPDLDPDPDPDLEVDLRPRPKTRSILAPAAPSLRMQHGELCSLGNVGVLHG
jgi:hypothetical protein